MSSGAHHTLLGVDYTELLCTLVASERVHQQLLNSPSLIMKERKLAGNYIRATDVGVCSTSLATLISIQQPDVPARTYQWHCTAY